MTARDLKTLHADHETADTLRSALVGLIEIEKQDPAWAAATRDELLEELRVLEGQGSSF